MTARRWRVRYRPTMLRKRNMWGDMWEEPAQPWLVEKVRRGGKERRFRTLPDAHTYAMRMSRTVEVELPKVEDVHEIVSASLALGVVRAPSGDAFLSAGGRDFDIWKQEFKPLGEYLLALHYHYERNQK